MACYEIRFYFGRLRSGGLTAGNVIFGLLIADALDREGRRLLNAGRIIKHGDCVPRAVFGAKGTTDASFDIDFNDLLKLREIRAGDDFNTIHRTEYDTGLAAGTAVLINDG